ncbi:Ran-binding protein, putative [Rhizoctonia solani AG-3 Rhs1AP]|uniref:Ran-binding protein, putative n=1 Tax=Rhizoctonia solani AG-3 Rhs1AP TaxID=1086054 RepID=X8IUK9_9AGAM|nr:Ran-binding protein, putative [Rhizoctonia solani AG-3 Rhs1AP]
MKFSSALLTSALVCLVTSSVARDIPLAARYAIEARQKKGDDGKGGNGGNKGGNGGNDDDPQTSLTLDPSVVNSNFAKTGQEDKSEAGQVASLTSKNNFINFCAGKKLTNGQQVKGGSCNSTPMGDLPSTSKQPSSKFTAPKNLETVAANKAFIVKMAVKNMEMGNFVNPQTNYFAAPQQLNGQGVIGCPLAYRH